MQNNIWKITGTAVQGRSHIANDIPCQDKIFSMSENGITAIALADGAGSASMSHYGAETAVKTVCEYICDNFEDIIKEPEAFTVKKAIMTHIRECLEELVEEFECDLYEVSSTLIAAAADNENVLLIHIGDGIAGYFKNGELLVASYPDNGEFKNETTFTTSPDTLQRMRLLKGNIAGISGFVLMSDGAAESFFDRQNKKFIALTNEIKRRCIMYPQHDNDEELKVLFENKIRYNRTRDDCSMILMCHADEYFRGYRDLDEYDQNVFLGTRTSEGKCNREKIFDIMANSEYISRSQVIKSGCETGLKRKQVTGLLRNLNKDNLIKKVFLHGYKLNFDY